MFSFLQWQSKFSLLSLYIAELLQPLIKDRLRNVDKTYHHCVSAAHTHRHVTEECRIVLLCRSHHVGLYRQFVKQTEIVQRQ